MIEIATLFFKSMDTSPFLSWFLMFWTGLVVIAITQALSMIVNAIINKGKKGDKP